VLLISAWHCQDAEWEHEEVQDDDQDQGVDNEEYFDDPKIRKELGKHRNGTERGLWLL
jgi:hypothetical protein